MKKLISYCDIPVMILAIYLAVMKWKKENAYYKERRRQLEIDESIGIFNSAESRALRLSEQYTKKLLLLVIVGGVLAIYFRLNSDMPNIFLLFKEMLEIRIDRIIYFTIYYISRAIKSLLAV